MACCSREKIAGICRGPDEYSIAEIAFALYHDERKRRESDLHVAAEREPHERVCAACEGKSREPILLDRA